VPKYRVLRGLNYPPGKRAEAGEVRDDIPEQSIPWLLKAHAIEPVVTVRRDVNPYPRTPKPDRKEA